MRSRLKRSNVNFRRRLWLGTACAAIGFSAQPGIAVAQDASATPASDEIIVTANRVEQNLQDVSGVVQAFTADQLRLDGIADLRNLQVAVPGLNISNAEGNVDIFIRGVGSANNTELGDPAAAPHFNGTYIPRPRGLGVMFYDLERVEVSKGPQGTLYGRNALAGTLNIISAKPKLGEFGGYAQAEISPDARGGQPPIDPAAPPTRPINATNAAPAGDQLPLPGR